MGGGILATAPAPILWTALITLAIGGVGNGLSNVAMRVLLQSRVGDAFRGRVYSAYQASLGVADFAALAIGGALIELVGARWSLALAGSGCALVALYGLAGVRARPEPLLHCPPSTNSRSRPYVRRRATYATGPGGVRERRPPLHGGTALRCANLERRAFSPGSRRPRRPLHHRPCQRSRRLGCY